MKAKHLYTYKQPGSQFRMEGTPYRVVDAVSPENKLIYQKLAQDYWNWVYGVNRDANPTNPNDSKVVFLRDDIVGDQLHHDVGISNARPGERDLEKNISIDAGTSLFFPIYHICSNIGHPYVKGGDCDTLDKCRDATRIDQENCYKRWAKIKVNDGQLKDIVAELDLDKHKIETDKITVEVPDPNELNREAGFSLPPGQHDGIIAGTYLYLVDLQPGNYDIDFGARATDFHTSSKYNVIVK
jgi:hypothetical protein